MCWPDRRRFDVLSFFFRSDIESTELLVEYDSSQKSLDLFGNNATDSNQEDVNTNVAQAALDEATHAISELVRRVSVRPRPCDACAI